ncbi:replicative DNA helicase [Actinomadura pelletieri DSM 43383]|uniref:Replicative DNA helicase n=1 Tax=Actinomadura pelletieri DSM 43383 TaxID=1120940 RepID=A0A495QYY4_9ACTN|nr:replicative DNA helicase [Actinomadura pelletieri]RKS79332.1 replicative DNA helicase [Actinomadura pelletieri DSM 43383]
MSVAEIGPPDPEFERTPPHDISAEQGVLGGMLLSQDAIAEVVELLRTPDFYRPAHQIIYDTILDLYGRGDPADAVTVAGELTKNGEIGRIGGAPYLHTLISSVPTAANAGYYAKIVHERAILRRLVETGTRIVQMGYAADGADADEVLDRAQAEVFAIAEKRAGEDYVALSEIMPGALDEIEAIGSRGGQMVGCPTGFADLDALTNGLHPGQMIVVAARPAMGKATSLDTPLPTPTGWTTMGEVSVGDYLIGADGKPTRVVAATEVMHDRPCYEIEFSDGEVIVADAQHQWRTTTRATRRQPDEPSATKARPHTAINRVQRTTSGSDDQPHGAVSYRQSMAEVASVLSHALHAVPQQLGDGAEAHASTEIRATHARSEVAANCVLSATTAADDQLDSYRQAMAEAGAALSHALHAVPQQLGDGAEAHASSENRATHARSEVAANCVLSAPAAADDQLDSYRQAMAEVGAALNHALHAVPQQLGDGAEADARETRATRSWSVAEIDRDQWAAPDADRRSVGVVDVGAGSRSALPAVTGQSGHLGVADTSTTSPQIRYECTRPNQGLPHRAARPTNSAAPTRPRPIKTTEEIAATVRCADDDRPNHAVEVAAPFQLPNADLPIEPYVLGAWLGDGRSWEGGLTCFDKEILEEIEAAGQPVERHPTPGQFDLPGLTRKIKEAGLWRNKRIPAAYLRASEDQRRALLAGMLDTTAHVTETGRVQLALVNKRLAEGVHELILSLGHRATMTTETSTVHRIDFTPAETVFRLPRKAARQRKSVHPSTRVRYIVDVRPVESVPVRCVQVDNADHMYLAGRSCIPTHNSTLALDFARAASIKHGLTSAFFSLEMGRNEITMRLLSAEARVALHAMRSGTMQDEDWTRLARRMSEVAEAPLFIDDSPNMSMMEIRAKCRRLKQQHDLRLVIVDYLQLMTSGKRVESRQVEVSEFSRSLKLLAKELGVPVIALSQLNRGPEQRTDKKPMVSDLRESGSIEQDADMVILLHREDAYEKESPRAGEADLIVAKHRNGPTATVTVAFQGHYSRFVDMAQ